MSENKEFITFILTRVRIGPADSSTLAMGATSGVGQGELGELGCLTYVGLDRPKPSGTFTGKKLDGVLC